MSISATWQQLPEPLLEAVLLRLLTLVEASEMFDLLLLHDLEYLDELSPLVPKHLTEPMSNLILWMLEPAEGVLLH